MAKPGSAAAQPPQEETRSPESAPSSSADGESEQPPGDAPGKAATDDTVESDGAPEAPAEFESDGAPESSDVAAQAAGKADAQAGARDEAPEAERTSSSSSSEDLAPPTALVPPENEPEATPAQPDPRNQLPDVDPRSVAVPTPPPLPPRVHPRGRDGAYPPPPPNAEALMARARASPIDEPGAARQPPPAPRGGWSARQYWGLGVVAAGAGLALSGFGVMQWNDRRQDLWESQQLLVERTTPNGYPRQRLIDDNHELRRNIDKTDAIVTGLFVSAGVAGLVGIVMMASGSSTTVERLALRPGGVEVSF